MVAGAHGVMTVSYTEHFDGSLNINCYRTDKKNCDEFDDLLQAIVDISSTQIVAKACKICNIDVYNGDEVVLRFTILKNGETVKIQKEIIKNSDGASSVVFITP
jgi:hypothetical protein